MSSNQQPPNMLYPVANGTVSSNPFVEVFNETRAPTTSDVNFPIQKRWFDKSTNKEWILVGFTTTSGQLQADWRRTSEPIEFTGGTGTAGTFPVSADVNGDILLESSDLSMLITGGINSLDFTTNGSVVTESFTVDAVTAPGVNPVTPTAGIVTVGAAAVAAHNVPIETRSRALHEYKTEVQYASSNATTNAAKVGLAAFSSAQFSVDANGFVTLAGGTTPPILGLVPDAFVAPGTSPVVPDGSGNINLTAGTVAAGSNPLRTRSLADNTLKTEAQFSQAIAATDATKVGLAAFNSAQFSVDPNGFVQASGVLTQDLHWPKFIVGDTANGANYATIAAALTAASSGDTIAIQPGTYTENLTLKAGVNIVGLSSDPTNPNVNIVGKMSYTGTGTVTISEVRLTTNGDYFLEVTGSNASVVFLENCFLNCLDNSGIHYTSSSASSEIHINYCNYLIGLTTVTLFISTSVGEIFIRYTSNLSGAATTIASTANTTNIFIFFSRLSFPLTITAAAGQISHSALDCENSNVTALTTVTSGTTSLNNANVTSGTASAISIGAGTIVSGSLISFSSSNSNVVTGAGTFNYTNIAFRNSSSTGMNATTLTASTIGIGAAKFFQATGTTGTSVSKVMNYYEEGTFTPTVDGSVSGTTTYGVQNGYYTKIGNMCFVQATVTLSAMTGTGNIVLGGLPFTVKNQTNGNSTGSIFMNNNAAWTWTAGNTSATLAFVANSTRATVITFGSGVAQANLQCQNAAAAFTYSGWFQV